MEETKARNDELQRVNEQVTKFEALHEELKKEIILLTGEAGPDKIREEFQSEFKLKNIIIAKLNFILTSN